MLLITELQNFYINTRVTVNDVEELTDKNQISVTLLWMTT